MRHCTVKRSMHRQAGFSLVEIFVVVGIVGALVVVGYPQFSNFTISARQAEAKNNLSQIFTLEQAYLNDNGTYANMSKIGPTGTCSPSATQNPIRFQLLPCSTSDWKVSRYVYSVTNADDTSFRAKAKSGRRQHNQVRPGDNNADVWEMDEHKRLTSDTEHED